MSHLMTDHATRTTSFHSINYLVFTLYYGQTWYPYDFVIATINCQFFVFNINANTYFNEKLIETIKQII